MRKTWKKKGLILLLLMAFGLSLAGTSWAWADRGYHSPYSQTEREGWMKWRKKVDLNLTSAQKEKLAKLRLSLQEETLDLRTQLMKKRLELRKLWLENTPDRTKIYSLINEVSKIRAEIYKEMVDSFLKLRDILTPEQLEKLSPLGLGWRRMGYPLHLCR